jgi:hypothetical protein
VDYEYEEMADEKLPGKGALGSVIIIALCVLTPVLVAGGSLMSALTTYAREIELRSGRSVASMIATSGAHDALAQLNQDITLRQEIELEVNAGVAVSVLEDLDDPTAPPGSVSIRTEGWKNALLDENGDPVERSVRWYRSVVEAVARPIFMSVPIEQAVYLGSPTDTTRFNGATFDISGEDEAGVAQDVYAIAVPGNTDNVVDELSNPQQSCLSGKIDPLETLSVGTVPAMNLQRLIDDLEPGADYRYDSENNSLSGFFGDADNPAITYVDGNGSISGSFDGTGVLLVTQNLTVSGNVDFDGLVVVLGNVSFNGGGGGINVEGALLVGGQDSDDDILQINGNVEITYDSSMVSTALVTMPIGLELAEWTQDTATN